jgi:fructose-1,6-bisphosphatase/inositol monophosphatase family enzyme
MPSNAPFADFVRLLEPGVRDAAALARSLEGRVANVPKEHETNLAKQALTEADTRTQEVLLATLREHFPAVRLQAEEDTPGVAGFPDEGEAEVVIDPIDGTLHSYLEGGGPYAVMVGLVEAGSYRSGLVALPREGLLFAGGAGEGAFRARAGGPLQPVSAEADGDRILVSHGMPEAASDHLRTAGFEVISACGGAVSVAPLIRGVRAGVRWSSNGGIGVSVRGRIGAVIAREAGAWVMRDGGDEFPLDTTTRAATLTVTAREEDQDVLRAALDAAGLPA